MGVVGYKAHKKADAGRSWDGAGARRRLLEWAGGPDKDSVDWGKYSQGFAWFDSENRENVGAYKLPHSDIIDGGIADVWAGVSAAMGALLGARGGTDIPDGDRKGVFNHLRQHYAQFDKEAPEFREYSEAELRGLFPEFFVDGMARMDGITAVRAELAQSFGPLVGGAEQLALEAINTKFAQKRLTAGEVYLLPPAEMSNGNLDSYFTRMAESSLRRYELDGKAGVPLMNSHRRVMPSPELPLGQSYEASLEQENGQLRLVEMFYMLRGLELNGHKTDDLIRAIEGGVIRDVSIGFGGGWYKCGLCGKELAPMAFLFGGAKGEFCEHVPGVRYDGQTAFAWVEDAQQIEGSLVYAGATPDAVLRKARWAAQTGRLARGDARVLEDQWGSRIVDSAMYAVGRATMTKQEEVTEMTKEEVLALVQERAPELAQRVTEAEEPVGALVDAWLDALKSRADSDKLRDAAMAELQERMGTLEHGLAEKQTELESVRLVIDGLQPLAEDGKAFRADLVGQAVAARVRAQGDAFDAEAYQKVLEAQPVAYVRGEIAAWEKAARGVFEPGRPVGKVLARQQDTGKQAADSRQQTAPGKPTGVYKA